MTPAPDAKDELLEEAFNIGRLLCPLTSQLYDGAAIECQPEDLFRAASTLGRLCERVEALTATAALLRDAIEHTDGCFEAALCEGWNQALADGDIEAIRDLWNRRLSFARQFFPTALALSPSEAEQIAAARNRTPGKRHLRPLPSEGGG